MSTRDTEQYERAGNRRNGLPHALSRQTVARSAASGHCALGCIRVGAMEGLWQVVIATKPDSLGRCRAG